MRFTSKTQAAVYRRLEQLAGSPVLVENALRSLDAGENPPTLEQIVEYILELRAQLEAKQKEIVREAESHAAAV